MLSYSLVDNRPIRIANVTRHYASNEVSTKQINEILSSFCSMLRADLILNTIIMYPRFFACRNV